MKEESEVLSVKIREDLSIDFEVVNVRLSAGDEIEWTTTGGPVTINFDDDNHPFADCSFITTKERPARSGPPVGGIGSYEYYIRSESLAQSADPGVNIKP
jgi:plastocyanin